MKCISRHIAVFAVLTACITNTLLGSIVTDQSDVLFVVGSGTHRANLVIDFQDGKTPESFAWGFRFDGADVSGADMLLAVAAADSRLTVASGGSAENGFFVNSISYDDGTDTHTDTSFGYFLAGGSAGDDTVGPGGIPTPVTGGGTVLPSSWTLSPTGSSDVSFDETGRLLTDGAWDAWSVGAWTEDPPGTWNPPPAPSGDVFAAIPEPSVAVLILLGTALGVRLLRHRRG